MEDRLNNLKGFSDDVRILISPQRYIQGPDTRQQIGVRVVNFNMASPLVLTSPGLTKACGERDTVQEG